MKFLIHSASCEWTEEKKELSGMLKEILLSMLAAYVLVLKHRFEVNLPWIALCINQCAAMGEWILHYSTNVSHNDLVSMIGFCHFRNWFS